MAPIERSIWIVLTGPLFLLMPTLRRRFFQRLDVSTEARP